MLLDQPAIQRIRPLVRPLGFKHDGPYFYRVTGDVTQRFCLVRFSPLELYHPVPRGLDL